MGTALVTLCLSLSTVAHAQEILAGTAGIHGIVRDERGRAVPFALVVLLRTADTSVAPLASTLSDSAGSFAFGHIALGTFFLHVRRLGYQMEAPTRTVVMSAQDDVVILRSIASPILLPAVRVSNACLDNRTLSQDSGLATLWTEAKKTVAARRAFFDAYHFLVDVSSLMEKPGSKTPNVRHDTTYAVDPGQPLADTGRTGQPGPFGELRRDNGKLLTTIRNPVEADLLDTTFLDRYCLEGGVDQDSAGSLVVTFRPLTPGPEGEMAMRGTITFDTAIFGPIAIANTFEYQGQIVGHSSVTYANGIIGPAPVRLPIRTMLDFVDPRKKAVFVRFTIARTYRDFVKLP